jgi:predicted nucleic acid-binding protein
MAVVCDTGAVYALYDADDAQHAACKAVVESERGPLFLPVVLLAEIDYLLTSRLGAGAALEFLEGVEAGAFTLVGLASEDLSRCRQLIAQYRDLNVGLADATVAAAAERLQIQRLFTLDQRHFRTIQPRDLGHFIILPADQEQQ